MSKDNLNKSQITVSIVTFSRPKEADSAFSAPSSSSSDLMVVDAVSICLQPMSWLKGGSICCR